MTRTIYGSKIARIMCLGQSCTAQGLVVRLIMSHDSTKKEDTRETRRLDKLLGGFSNDDGDGSENKVAINPTRFKCQM